MVYNVIISGCSVADYQPCPSLDDRVSRVTSDHAGYGALSATPVGQSAIAQSPSELFSFVAMFELIALSLDNQFQYERQPALNASLHEAPWGSNNNSLGIGKPCSFQ